LHGEGSRGAGANPDPMSEPRVQRTLVKSPPELWAEVSDVGTLARHLGAFGEIRITRLENETTVVWEGDRACGTVELEASGWGTKVTITAAAVESPAQEAEPEPAAVAAAEGEVEAVEVVEVVEVEPVVEAVEVDVEPVVEAEAVEVEPVAVVGPEPVAVAPEPVVEPDLSQVTASLAALELDTAPAPAPKRGLFSRLFGRRAPAPPVHDPQPVAIEPPAPPAVEPEPEPVIAVAEPEPVAAVAEPDTEPVVEAEPAAMVEPVAAAEPVVEPEPEPAAPALDADGVEAVLVGVLDDLGSAHHRPFSRG
jgi:hypothetical protein